MRVLVDTHCWLWWLSEPDRLPPRASAVLAATENERFLSAASVWEIAIKWRRGKLRLPDEPQRFVPDAMRLSGVLPLEVTQRHVLGVAALPLHHHDPFDRLLVAQAQIEGLALLTVDRELEPYGVKIVWA